jgi:hypothetical protein
MHEALATSSLPVDPPNHPFEKAFVKMDDARISPGHDMLYAPHAS